MPEKKESIGQFFRDEFALLVFAVCIGFGLLWYVDCRLSAGTKCNDYAGELFKSFSAFLGIVIGYYFGNKPVAEIKEAKETVKKLAVEKIGEAQKEIEKRDKVIEALKRAGGAKTALSQMKFGLNRLEMDKEFIRGL